jgi:hypothetical protein
MSADLRTRFDAWWFAPRSPVELGVGRSVFFGVLSLLYAPYDFRSWADVAPVFWYPTWSFAVLHLPVLDAAALGILQRVWKLALVCACLGLATRASILTALVLGFYLLGLPHCFGKIHHYDAFLIFVFAILAVARSGDAFALDRVLSRRCHGTVAPAVVPSGEYTRPLRAIRVMLALVFFTAGMSKLRTSGLGWIFSDTMAIFLVQHQYHLGNAVPLTAFGLVLARHAWLCRSLAAATIAGETRYPLALISRPARAVLVPGMLLMQLGIRVLLGPTFLHMMACNVFWVPWERVVGWARRRTAGRAQRRAFGA